MPTIQYSARSARLSVGVSKDNKWSKSFDIRRMTAVDRRFNRIRQVAAMCPPMRSHLRHMANTIELVHFSAHSSPQPKRQMDRFNRFCTDDRKVSLYFTVIRPFPPPLKIAPSHGVIWFQTCWFLGPTQVLNPNGNSIASAVLQGSLV